MRAVWVLPVLLTSVSGFAQVTSNSILEETVDLSRLTKRPSPFYTTAQASSYDRKSKTPGNPDWFANADAGQFIREERREGRLERVMADLTGPGAVVRIWSANPAGTLRFYFDGEETARWTVKCLDLLGGKTEPFGFPFGYESARGWNFYYPIPYAKSLKITVDDTDQDRARSLYYHVGYRTYEAGTAVETFRPDNVDQAALDKAGKLLTNPYVPGYLPDTTSLRLRPGGSATMKLPPGPRAVTYFRAKLSPLAVPAIAAWDDARQPYNQLRQIVLEADFDGETCVRVPLGDFFGAAPGINPYQTFPMQVDADGTMSCRFVMPYAKTGTIRLVNMGGSRAEVQVSAETLRYDWDANSYHFKAQWSGEHARTRPMRDMTFLKTTGEGVFVGDNMLVSNPDPAWWGEGDEKIYVDGETFPSSFGTGSEDYFGYAWGASEVFARPFHAQPHTGNPGSFGHSLLERFHIMDAVHFQKDFKFDLEQWHWADVIATFVHTAYWYEKPVAGRTRSATPVAIDPKLLVIYELKPPAPVKDAIEGENLVIAAKTGGETEKQEGFWQTSGNTQLWWKEAPPGSKLDLIVPVPKAGRYKVTGHFCFARDYGIQKLTLNGKALAPIDFYSPNLEWRTVKLGVHDLPAGTVHLVVEVAGTNPKANPKSYMFGLDYLKLDK